MNKRVNIYVHNLFRFRISGLVWHSLEGLVRRSLSLRSSKMRHPTENSEPAIRNWG